MNDTPAHPIYHAESRLVPYRIAYCSNVHAGADLFETRQNLQTHSVQVKKRYSPNDGMGVGLWLSDASAASLMESPAESAEFSAFLDREGLQPFTFNGFPFGNFHQPVVKHAVYQPTWSDPARLTYTQNLAELIHRFAPPGTASISTLPICWGHPAPPKTELDAAASQLRDLATYLSRFEQETDRRINVCIEPEPGCFIQRAEDIVHFFENHLLTAGDEQTIRRHIQVCHDVCHSVVMAETQEHAFSTYRDAGIGVGKVQISSAVWVDFDSADTHDRRQAVTELSAFAEDRYLHQTTIQHGNEPAQFFEDLPAALATITDPSEATGVWRIHFHVPVYLQQFGQLQASQQAILDCVRACRTHEEIQHFEVETYAWNVLPHELQQDELANGIAAEMEWFREVAQEHLGDPHA